MDFADSDLSSARPPQRRRVLRAVLTRAVEQQHAWREAVELAGFECESLPLFRVVPIASAELRANLGDMSDIRLIVVISPNAAQGIAQMLAHSVQYDLALHQVLSHAQYAVPGPGTRDALTRMGISPSQIICPIRRDFAYDTQALLQAVRAAVQFGQIKTGKALIVHGDQTSPDLSAGLAAMGLPSRGVAAYKHGPVSLEPAQTLRMATLLTSVHEVVWVLSQTRAVSHLHALAHNLRPTGLKGHRAIAIHPRIATAATQAGFAEVRLIEPSPVSLVGALVMMSEDPGAKPLTKAAL